MEIIIFSTELILLGEQAKSHKSGPGYISRIYGADS
jgi:hypothetical protein